MLGWAGDEFLRRRHHRSQAALHVRGAAPEEDAIARSGTNGSVPPLLERPRRHDIGVAGKAEHRAAGAAAGPEVVDVAVAQPLDPEAECLEASAIITSWQPSSAGSHGPAGHQILSQLKGLRHRAACCPGAKAVEAESSNGLRLMPARAAGAKPLASLCNDVASGSRYTATIVRGQAPKMMRQAKCASAPGTEAGHG